MSARRLLYQYCGPVTELAKRLARGDPGIYPLDQACREHDIAYSQNLKDIEARIVADRILADRARQRISAEDLKTGEKIAAYAITKTMALKSRERLEKNEKG